LTALVGTSIATHGFVLQNLGWLKSIFGPTSSPFEFLLTGGTLYAAIVALPLWLYDNYFWKLLNPRFNFSGEWTAKITAIHPMSEKQITESAMALAEDIAADIMSAEGHATIQQTITRIWIEEGSGPTIDNRRKAHVTWTAEVIPIKMPGEIVIAFEAVTDRAVSGRDHVVVKARDWRGRPSHLVGSAFHVLPDADFTIKADVEYVRKTSKLFGRPMEPHSAAALPSPSHVRKRDK